MQSKYQTVVATNHDPKPTNKQCVVTRSNSNREMNRKRKTRRKTASIIVCYIRNAAATNELTSWCCGNIPSLVFPLELPKTPCRSEVQIKQQHSTTAIISIIIRADEREQKKKKEKKRKMVTKQRPKDRMVQWLKKRDM